MQSLLGLYNTYGALVRSQLLDVLGPRIDVDDLAEDVLLAYWQCYAKKPPHVALGPLLLRMATDAAVQVLQAPTSHVPPHVVNLLQRVSARDTVLVMLHWRSALTASELARVVGSTEHDIELRLHRLAIQVGQPVRKNPTCLSSLGIYSLAAGEHEQTPSEGAHLNACSVCGERLATAVAAALDSRDAPLPPRLQVFEPVRKTLQVRLPNLTGQRVARWGSFAALLLMACGGFYAYRRAHAQRVPELIASVRAAAPQQRPRLDAVITAVDGARELAPLTDSTAVAAGDEVRLRIVWAGEVKATIREEGGEIFYDGLVPSDGWLPMTLTASPPGLRLQMRICSDGVCWHGVYRFATHADSDGL